MTSEQSGKPLAPDIAGYNDAIAAMYDDATAAEAWPVNRRLRHVLETRLQTVQAVLDLGAGTGQTVDVINRLVHPPHIVAVDASQKMLDHLQQKYPIPSIVPIHTTIEDFTSSSQETFDLITAMGSLEFVQNLPAVLEQTAQLLNTGGILCATYIPRTDGGEEQRTFQVTSLGQAFTEYYWTPKSINHSLTAGGLIIESQESFPSYERGSETVTYSFLIAHKD